MASLKGIERVKDREKNRFYSGLAESINVNLDFSVTRKDHLHAALPGIPKWAHLAVVFHPREQQLGVELHFESSEGSDKNRAALRFVKRRISDSTLSTTESLTFDENWRETQGWTRTYIRKFCDAPTLDLRNWAAATISELHQLVQPCLEQAEKEGII